MASEEEQKENQGPAKSSKKILILVIVLLLIAGGAAGAYLKFFAHSAKSEEGQKEKEAAEPILKELDTFIVNLSDPGGKRFLKVAMKAKFDSQQAANEFTSRVFEYRDAIIMILSAKETEEVSKTSDKMNLKQEIVTAINRTMKKGQVQDIYFTEFLIQ